MNHRSGRGPFIAIALFCALGCTQAQWLNYKDPNIPRTRDGKPDLAARAPRTREGKPDLSGVWHVQPTGRAEMKRLFGDDADKIEVPGMEIDTVSKYGINILVDFKPEDSPMRPETAAIFKRNLADSLPSKSCLPIGLPMDTMLSEVTKIVQTPRLLVIMLESDSAVRQIHTDGRKLPPDPSPSWFGYSVGKWEGDALAVDTVGFNDKSWLDALGHPHSESLRLRERYRRRDFGHMDVETTVDDPKMYTRPFTVKATHELQADSDILEYICAENEKDNSHIK
ncbi:MAG TPA: hypothetical protein VGR73_12160 [Bryobacteraceae bacterium]|nr:hypothetical protein [Bryobacteraceae bacterium]